MSLIKFLASTTGRIIRIVAGVALVVLGLFVIQNTAGIIVAVIGAVPLLAGLVDVCVFAPLFSASFYGHVLRTAK